MKHKSITRKTDALRSGTFGRYNNFPSLIHGMAHLSHQMPLNILKSAVINCLFKLNNHKESFLISERHGELALEVGVAKGIIFDYLSEEELRQLLRVFNSSKTYSVLDVILIITYHYFRGGKKIPLKFDYYLLRFIFQNKKLELLLFHDRGIRRTPPDKLIRLVIKSLCNEVERRYLIEFKIENIWSL